MTDKLVYRPRPPGPRWSATRLLAVEVANRVPEAHYDLYQNVAEAYNDSVRVHGLDFAEHNAHTFGILIDDVRESGKADEHLTLAEWSVPWHRLRDNDGLCRGYGRGKIYDVQDLGNQVYLAEGGHLTKGMGGTKTASASPRERVDLRRLFRSGEIEYPTL